jgi:hypothetical protein
MELLEEEWFQLVDDEVGDVSDQEEDKVWIDSEEQEEEEEEVEEAEM